MAKLCVFITILASLSGNGDCSIGDKSPYYNACLKKCHATNCTNDINFKEKPSMELSLLFWTCKDDCRYVCMWDTVTFFQLQKSNVPKFHGKWPFKRFFGVQEPASVIFSLLNFQAHLMLYRRFKQEVRSSNPMYITWTYFSMVCMNGWLWSTIFHARDTAITEVMDYSCAFIIVLTSLFSMLLRISSRSWKEYAVINTGYVGVFYMHLSHLWSGQINYGYNMILNLTIGFLTFLTTMVWWYRNKRAVKHAMLIGWFNILTVLVTLLEVLDFPPIFWIFDAHSLWHASTVPLTVLLYRFMIKDSKYLRRQYERSLLDKKNETEFKMQAADKLKIRETFQKAIIDDKL